MPKRTLRLTESAIRDLAHLRAFLRKKHPAAAKRSSQAIAQALRVVEAQPETGRPVEILPGCRELIIEYGAAGYVALYRVTEQHIVILALRHQREAGYRE